MAKILAVLADPTLFHLLVPLLMLVYLQCHYRPLHLSKGRLPSKQLRHQKALPESPGGLC